MVKKKYYWKALRIEGDKFTSCIVMGKYCLVYPVGKWVKPPVGKIFIFKTRQHALNFNGDWSATHVKKCEAKSVTEPRGKRLDFDETGLFRSFWRKIFKNGSLPICDDWPHGTLWAKAIKIIG